MNLSGVFRVHKPKDLTSGDVVFRLKKSLTANNYAERGFRIGHGGTLDPFATGVLVILVGEATKLADTYLHSRKKYSGIIELGTKTDSADLTGETVEKKSIPSLSAVDWQTLADTFTVKNQPEGYPQTPPMHSAKKVDGKPLYQLAHQGKSIDREAIRKKIYSFSVTPLSATQLTFEVDCESGTYVRVIAEDLAQKAGTVGHLSKLERMQSSDIELSHCEPLESLLAILDQKPDLKSVPAFGFLFETATHVGSFQISETDAALVRQGLPRMTHALCVQALQKAPHARYLLVKHDSELVALLEKGPDQPYFRVQRVFNPQSVSLT